MNNNLISEWFFGLSSNVKGRTLIFGCSVLVSAWFVSMIIKYSLVVYAISYGFRAPLEGSPVEEVFTTFMVLIFSVALYMVAYVSLPSVYFSRKLNKVTKFLKSYIIKYNQIVDYISEFITLSDESESRLQRINMPLLLLSLLLVIILIPTIYILFTFVNETLDVSNERIEFVKLFLVVLGIPYMWATLYLAILTLLYPAHRQIYCGILAILYSVIMFVIPLHPEIPISLLRFTSHGGGIAITIDLDEAPKNSKVGCRLKHSSHLMLLTNKAVILYEHKEVEFLEIPVKRICEIRLSPEKEVRMPSKSPNFWQLLFGFKMEHDKLRQP